MRIYIGTWGNPLSWREVEYDCMEVPRQGSGNSERRHGIASIVCADNYDKYIIYAVDSVLTASVSKSAGNSITEECAKEQNILTDLGDGKAVMPPPGSDIRDLRSWRDMARNYIRCISSKIISNTDIILTASRGTFTLYKDISWKYEASYPATIVGELLWGLWQKVKDEGVEGDQVDLDIDLTHGINFMPALTLHVGRFLASLLLMKGARKVMIRAFNATPGDWLYMKFLSEDMATIEVPAQPRSPIIEALGKGLPLVMHRLCNDNLHSVADDVFNYVEASIDLNGRTVKYKNPGINVERLYESLLEQLACKRSTNKLSQLLNSELFSKVNKTIEAMVKHELNNMKNGIDRASPDVMKQLNNNEKVKYSKVLPWECVERQDECSPCPGGNDRNLIAHAGLLRECTSIRKSDSDYVIEIDDKVLSCLDNTRDEN
ncbi:TM1812 family CRISPR-associated protein [Thermocladium modestius]|nr:TM1812 family CRISPR-associated protein [Thermocladium modestius]